MQRRPKITWRRPLAVLFGLTVLLALDGSGLVRVGLGCAILHESGHALAYRALWGHWPELEVSPFGICLRLRGLPMTARQELLRNKSGLGMTVEVLPGHPLEAVCAAIAEAVGLVGVVNMEFIRHGDDFFFLEVNPRFSGGVGFTMQIRDFLELQRALHAERIVQIPADEEHVLLLRQPFGGRADILRMGEHLLHLSRQGLQPPYHSAVCLIIHGAQHIAEIQPQQVQHRHLGAVRFRGGHGDLRSGPGVEHVVALPGDGRAHHVHDGQHPGTALFGLAQGGHGVQRLTGLADDDDQIALAHQGVAVPEL